MALLIFPADNLAPPLAALLDPNLRRDVAKRVNEAILASQGEGKTKLSDLVKLRAWAEQKAREVKKDLPERIELGLGMDGEQGRDGLHGNGEGDAMVT